MSNEAFVATAFALSWTVIVGYLVHLRRVRQRATARLEAAEGEVT